MSTTLLGVTGDMGDRSAMGMSMALRRFGDFELMGEIGRGGMGVVYRARQISWDRMVALKLILSGELATPDAVRCFRQEVTLAARLRHPNIVTIHEVGERDGQPYLAMELVEGPSFASLARDGPLPARRAAGYVKAVAEAVAYAHRQRMQHCHLKPSNILLDPFDQPRATGFGFARQFERVSEPDLTRSGHALGSPGYVSPEQAAGPIGDASVAEVADVYGVGAVLYHLLTGRSPFCGESRLAVPRQVLNENPVSPRRLNSSVPPDLETICLKCLEKEPARRYGTAAELAAKLGEFLRE